VEGGSEALAMEVGPLGIHVTIVEPGPFRTDWAGRSLSSAPEIEDYAQTAGSTREYIAEESGNQEGDHQARRPGHYLGRGGRRAP
jgi:NAD(P)-dependent dehydrogenase (short-subunit alcohol dehydrogenase family)